MPIRKPKPVKMPTPFAQQELSNDEDARRRALLIKRELSRTEGFSWNEEQPNLVRRIRDQPLHKTLFAIAAMVMSGGLVAAFLFAMDGGIEMPTRVIYAESWRGDRTAQEAVDEREAAMDVLRAQVAENRRVYEAEQARQKALAAERAAARQATS
jgi:hypothetical protein